MADVKITDLTAVASVAGTNTFEVTEDPSGTPVSKKATAAQIATYIDAPGAAAAAVATHVAEPNPHTQYKLGADFSANGSSLVAAANYAAMRTLLDLEPGVDFYSISATDTLLAAKVAGPASVTDGRFALFDGTTGKLIKQHTGVPGALAVLNSVSTSQIDDDAVTFAKLLNATAAGFIGATGAGAFGERTPTQVTAALDVMVGDSGSGGAKGLVPAPAAGDAAASKYLKADGTWATVSGGGGGSVSNTPYGPSWDGATTDAPSQNAVYDKFEASSGPPFIAGNWYLGMAGDAVAGSALSADTIYFVWHELKRDITVSDLGARITTASAGGNCKLAIYANNPATGRPTGTPLAETASISTTSAANVSADITGANVTISAPGFWGAVWQDNATAAYRAVNRDATSLSTQQIGSTSQSTIANAAGRNAFLLSCPETFGTWPDVTSETFTEISNASQGAILHLKAA